MARLRFLLFCLTFSFTACLHAQPADSLYRAFDSSQQKLKQLNADVQRVQDSVAEEARLRNNLENSRNLEIFLADMKEREQADQRRAYLRIALGLIFIAVLIVGLMRKRKLQRPRGN